jgi:formamidopyrimidine-DNA glycosylase
MPELPEIETLRMQLSDLIIGLTIKEIVILKKKSFIGDTQYVTGDTVKGIRRYGKMLVFSLSNGLSLLVHLKMSGQLIYKEQRTKNREQKNIDFDPLLLKLPNKHTRVIIHFTNGSRLFFNDMRIFGWIKILKRSNFKFLISNFKSIPKTEDRVNFLPELEEIIERLGPDPLKELDKTKFQKILKSSKKPIKLLLMDQEKIAGVGNIYANDSLFLSGINPKLKANNLSGDQVIKLLRNLQKVLKDGIKWGGASRNNFRDAYGRKGHVQEHFYVYNREGMDCLNGCGEKVQRIKLGGRGTFFCPKCQK